MDFWSRVDTSGSCWFWQGKPDKCGYGQLKYNGKTERAHRVAWQLSNGQIPDGKIVRHRCDRPLCCNPNHLLLGTHQDNVADRVARKRSATGERNGRAKLSVVDVAEIKKLLANSVLQKDLAARFRVDQTVISRIKLGKSWGP